MRFQMLKRDMKLFLHCLLPALVLTAVFAAVCAAAGLAAVKSAEDVYTPVKAAVVDGEDSVFSRMLIRAVANTDYIAGLLEISHRGEDEAMEGLKSGELAAVIVLPEGMIDGITSGRETRGQIYLSPAAAAHSDIVAATAAFGELLLTSGQYGVFSGEQLIWEYGLDSRFHADFLAEANGLLLGEAIGAGTRYFDVRVTDYADTAMSAQAYYAVSWIALLLMLSTLFFARLYTKDLERPILCRLRALGVRDGGFLLGKLLYPALFQAVVLLVILIAVGRSVPVALSAAALVCALAAVLLSAASCGVFLLLSHRGTPIVVVTVLAGIFLCGGVIPRQTLPDGLLLLGALTPYGAVQGLLQPLLGGELRALPPIIAAVYLVAAAVAACALLRRVRTGGEVQ